ncbi:hypothetical protein ACP70R_007321 [Stipagrostis hirtigluma subsp. patula]
MHFHSIANSHSKPCFCHIRLAANSSVTKDIQEPGDYGGFPAVPINEWRQQNANLHLLSKKDGAKR